MVRSLINRFTEFNRKPKERKSKIDNSSTTHATKQKSPGITRSVVKPAIPPGEDAVSYERHIKALQMEFKNNNRNDRIVGESNKIIVHRTKGWNFLYRIHNFRGSDESDICNATRRNQS